MSSDVSTQLKFFLTPKFKFLDCWFYHCFLLRFVFFKALSVYCQQINFLSPIIVTQTTYHLKMFFSVRKYIVEPSNRIRTICSGQDSSRNVWFNGCVYPCSKTKKSINGRTHSTCPNSVLNPILLQHNTTLTLFTIKSNDKIKSNMPFTQLHCNMCTLIRIST